MKPITIGLLLSLALFNSVQAGKSLPNVEVVNTENQRWRFRQVTVNHADTELTVSGRLNSHLRYGLPRGHVDIAVFSADNSKLILEITTAYSPRLLTRRASRKGGVRFSAKLPALPANARIKVAFHPDKPQQPKKPVHDQTVAL